MTSGSGRSVLAPPTTHFAITSISAEPSFFFPGGISPARRRLSSKLASGSPAVNAGPDLPPLAIVRLWRKSSLPLSGLASPWHSKQYAFKIGRTCDSNVGVTGSAASAPVTKQQPSVIGRRVRMSRQTGGNEVRRLILLWAENAHEAIGKSERTWSVADEFVGDRRSHG